MPVACVACMYVRPLVIPRPLHVTRCMTGPNVARVSISRDPLKTVNINLCHRRRVFAAKMFGLKNGAGNRRDFHQWNQ